METQISSLLNRSIFISYNLGKGDAFHFKYWGWPDGARGPRKNRGRQAGAGCRQIAAPMLHSAASSHGAGDACQAVRVPGGAACPPNPLPRSLIFRAGEKYFSTRSQSITSELRRKYDQLLKHFYCPSTKRARSRRSISNGVIHLMPRPMQASGILIFFVEGEAFSWVTTVCPWASAWATR